MVVHPDALEGLADRELVAQFQDGEDEAFAVLVRAHYSSLLAQARRSLRSQRDAEDAVQETLMRAYRALPRFGGEYRVRAWLGRILNNVCVDVAGQNRADRNLESLLAEQPEPQAPSADDSVPDQVLRDAIASALAELPDSHRRAFVLRDIEDLPYAQVAEAMGSSEVNARARVHRARTALKRSLSTVSGLLGSFFLPFRSLRALAQMVGGTRGGPRSELGLSIGNGPTIQFGSASQVASRVAGQLAASPSAQAVSNALPAASTLPGASALASIAAASIAILPGATAVFSSAPPVAQEAAVGHALVAPAPTTESPVVGPVAPAAVQEVPTTSTTTVAPPAPAPINNGWLAPDQTQWVNAASAAPGAVASTDVTGPGTSAAIPTAPTPVLPGPSSCPTLGQLSPATSTSVSAPPPELSGTPVTDLLSIPTFGVSTSGMSFEADAPGTLASASGLQQSQWAELATCEPNGVPVLAIQLNDPANAGAGQLELLGAFVDSVTSGGNTEVLFRGTAIPSTSSITTPVPFVADVEITPDTASLQVAFFAPLTGYSPWEGAPTTSSSSTPKTSSSQVGAGGPVADDRRTQARTTAAAAA